MINVLKQLIKYLEILEISTSIIWTYFKEIGKLLSKILLLNYIGGMKYVNPIWRIIQFLAKWSIYTTILTSFSSFIYYLIIY